jgi:tRNA(Ile)-lysidine synthase
VLVALSGGADSTSLLVALHRVAPEFGLEVAAAHLHHGLRGAEADGDLEFSRALCASLEVPFVSARWNARERARRRGLSGQEGLRRVRRDFLAAARRRLGAAAIATAHTADDQLETMLLRLWRGAGLPGLGGMRPRTGFWLKPLLEATRAEIEADLRAAGIAWREDSSNARGGSARNRVRHDAIPALIRACDPDASLATARAGLARRVGATAREARDAALALDSRTSRLLRESARIQRGGMALDSLEVASYPIAARRTALRAAWRHLAGADQGLTHRHVEALCRLVSHGRSGSFVLLPAGWRADRRDNRVHFRRSTKGRPMGNSND